MTKTVVLVCQLKLNQAGEKKEKQFYLKLQHGTHLRIWPEDWNINSSLDFESACLLYVFQTHPPPQQCEPVLSTYISYCLCFSGEFQYGH